MNNQEGKEVQELTQMIELITKNLKTFAKQDLYI